MNIQATDCDGDYKWNDFSHVILLFYCFIEASNLTGVIRCYCSIKEISSIIFANLSVMVHCYPMILGIDPGTLQSGFAVISETWREDGPLKAGVSQNEDILDAIAQVDRGTSVAIEMISSYGARVGQTTFDTLVWIGRMIQVCESNGIPYHLIKRHEVKKLIAPGERANDAVIRRKMIELLGWSAEDVRLNAKRCGLKSHAWQAMAVAVAIASETADLFEEKA